MKHGMVYIIIFYSFYECLAYLRFVISNVDKNTIVFIKLKPTLSKYSQFYSVNSSLCIAV